MDGLGLARLGRNIVLTIGRHFAGLLFGLGLAVLLARILGPVGNGQYGVAILIPGLLGTFLSLGVGPANVYFVGTGQVTLREALRITLPIAAAICLLGVIAGAALIQWRGEVWFPGVSQNVLWLALLAFPPFLLHTLLSSLIQARQRFDWFNRILILPPAVTLIAALVAVWALDWGVSAAISAFIGGYAVGALEALRLVRQAVADEVRGADFVASRETFAYLRKCLAYGWKAHTSNIIAFVNYRADILLVNLLLTPAATGVYLVAVQIAERMWILSQGVSAVLLPRLAELGSREDQRRMITPLVARWVAAASLVGGVVLALVAPWMLPAIFGRDFQPAIFPLLILIPGIVAGSFSKVLANDLAARGRPELNMYTSTLVITLNIGANIVLIPPLGISGAALATTLAYGANALVKLLLYGRLSKQPAISVLIPTQLDRQIVQQLLRRRGARR